MPGSRGNPGAFRLDWVSWQFSFDVGECIINITCGISLVPLSTPPPQIPKLPTFTPTCFDWITTSVFFNRWRRKICQVKAVCLKQGLRREDVDISWASQGFPWWQ